MVELIKGLAQVRDALTLIAFLALVLLVAFRTKKVPELFFGLLRDKLTRQQFYALTHRGMTFGFVGFLALLPLAVISQVLGYWTQPNALTLSDLRHELSNVKASEEQKIHAEAQYKLGMDHLADRDLTGAIASLQESVKALPTLTAQEMLTYLYRQKRDFANASTTWEAAVKTARERGDALALVRLDKDGVPRSVPDAEGEHDLIGAKISLPKGGDDYESAQTISPGLYECAGPDVCASWYKLTLRPGQQLLVKFRNPPAGGLAGITLFGTNGERLDVKGDGPGTLYGNSAPGGTMSRVAFDVTAGGTYFLRMNANPKSVYRIQIQ
jgi:hypothetical protein